MSAVRDEQGRPARRRTRRMRRLALGLGRPARRRSARRRRHRRPKAVGRREDRGAQDRVAAAQEKEAALRARSTPSRPRSAASSSRSATSPSRLGPLEHELELREVKLNRLNALFRVQTRPAGSSCARSTAIALAPAQPTASSPRTKQTRPTSSRVLLSSSSFTDFLDGLDYIQLVADADRQIADAVRSSRTKWRCALRATRRPRAGLLRQETQVVAVRVRQVRALRDQLVASQRRGSSTRRAARRTISLAERASERADADGDGLAAGGERRARREDPGRSGALDGHSARGSSAGLIWPVLRAGHEPVRLALGPDARGHRHRCRLRARRSRAAAAGTVIYAGWLGGYGNLRSSTTAAALATAYGHQSSIAVSARRSRSPRAR